VGYAIFTRLSGSDGHRIEYEIDPEIFEIRKIYRDSSFLRHFLTIDLARELKLFEYNVKNKVTKVSEVADEEGWEKIRETMITNIGLNGIPVIKVEDLDLRRQELQLVHMYDNRELELKYLEKTMEHIYDLWNNPVNLKTYIDNQKVNCRYNEGKFIIEKIS
jgi:stage V sporulation protein R